MNKKPREFWLSNPGGHWTIDFDGPPNYAKDAFASIVHVREVDPSYDKAVQGLVDALKSIAAPHTPRMKSESYWMETSIEVCVETLALDTSIARDALKSFSRCVKG